jgi:hypothetical protein
MNGAYALVDFDSLKSTTKRKEGKKEIQSVVVNFFDLDGIACE